MLDSRFTLTASLALAALLFTPLAFHSGLALAQTEIQPGDTGAAKKPKLLDFWQPGDAGQRMNIRGRVTSLDGTPLGGISISIRQADGEGDYSERYRGVVQTDAKGRYQFGSVIPGNYIGVRHVHIAVYQDGYNYFDTRILFKGDPNIDGLSESEDAIFLEESTVNGETIFFGRFDIVLTPG